MRDPERSGTMRRMVEPRVIPRAEHPISRRDIDPDALKVLYRLRQYNHIAYLVGGSVRDLLLGRGRRISTSARRRIPYQVKKLFRNCWIIGRRFRLAHVKFGRRSSRWRRSAARCRRETESETAAARTRRRDPPVTAVAPRPTADTCIPSRQHVRHARRGRVPARLHRSTRSSTTSRRSRSSTTWAASTTCAPAGPHRSAIRTMRFREDPGADAARRRAGRAARLPDRSADPRSDSAVIGTRSRSCAGPAAGGVLQDPAGGRSEKTFRALAETGLLEPIVSRAASRAADDSLWQLARRARRAIGARFESTPETLTNAVLLGSLLAAARARRHKPADDRPRCAHGVSGCGALPARAARRRAAAPDAAAPAAPARHPAPPRAPARAHPPQHFPRSADLARDPRRRTRAVEQWKTVLAERRQPCAGARRTAARRSTATATPQAPTRSAAVTSNTVLRRTRAALE